MKRKGIQMEKFEEFYESFNEDVDSENEFEQFEITDASTADWAIKKIADERKRAQYFIDCAKDEIEKLKGQIKEIEEKCENSTQFFTGCLTKYFERDEVPKKKTKTQESVTLPAGKIVKILPKTEYIMSNGEEISKNKSDDAFLNEIQNIDPSFIKTKAEVDWAKLKKNIVFDENGNVMLKDTGEFIESLKTQTTLPSIEIKTK